MKPVLIFDYDGTLHETMRIYAPAVYDTVRWLNTSCGVSVSVPDDARIQSWLGMNTADMWNSFMPDLDADLKKRAALRIGDGMLANLKAGRGGWYDGTEEMLDALAGAGFTMAVLSNCGISYAREHWNAFGMERWFTAFFPCECWDNAPKDGIMRDIARDFDAAVQKTPVRKMSGDGARVAVRKAPETPRFLVIGDRDSDFAAARRIGAPFIGCGYGYGLPEELAGADAVADEPSDIKKLLLDSPGWEAIGKDRDRT